MFIVAMTLAILASLGLYALSAATTETRQSGYERLNLQAHYMSEYSVVAAANSINYDTAQTYVNMANQKSDTSCISLPAVSSANSAMLTAETRLACYRIGKNELASTWGTSVPALPATNPFGPYPSTGDFYAELTDTACAPMAGMSGRTGVALLTMTTVGFAEPSGVSTGDQLYGNQGVELARVRVSAGPITCPQLGQ